jgi:hypothetical protein
MNASAIVRAWWKNTKELPFPIGMLCQGAMVTGPILLAFLVLPIVDWTINRRHMSYGELWSSGAGFVFTVFLLLVTFGAWGLAARNLNSRWALVAAPLTPYVAALPFRNTGWIAADDVLYGFLSGLVMAVIVYGCLFHLPAIRGYFAKTAVAHDA